MTHLAKGTHSLNVFVTVETKLVSVLPVVEEMSEETLGGASVDEQYRLYAAYIVAVAVVEL